MNNNTKKENEYWTKLKQLASEDNIIEFYKLYSQYLEWSKVLSPSRKAIYKMAKRVVELIETNNDET